MSQFRLVILFSIALFCALIEPICVYSQFDIKNNRKKCVIPFVKAGNLMVLKIFINNTGPFNFILDSGAGLTVITDPQIKESLNLDFIKELTIAGLGDLNELKADVVPQMKIQIGNIYADHVGAVILKEKQTDLSAYAGMPIHGIIGYDFFNSFEVETKYQSGLIICKLNNSKMNKKSFRLPLRIEQKKPYCEIDIETPAHGLKKIKTLLDCGGGHVLALENIRGVPSTINLQKVNVFLGAGLGGLIYGELARLPLCFLGKYKIQNLLCSYPDYSNHPEARFLMNRNASIGNNFLQFFNVIYNYRQQFVQFRPLYKKFPFLEYNMSGIEVYAGGKNFRQFYVGNVQLQRDTESCDIQKGDEIIAINFKSAKELTLNEINSILKSAEGQRVFLVTKRDGLLIQNLLILKRLI